MREVVLLNYCIVAGTISRSDNTYLVIARSVTTKQSF
jgi:hypothetical protein